MDTTRSIPEIVWAMVSGTTFNNYFNNQIFAALGPSIYWPRQVGMFTDHDRYFTSDKIFVLNSDNTTNIFHCASYGSWE